MSLSPKKPLGPKTSNMNASRHSELSVVSYQATIHVERPPPTNLPAFLSYASKQLQLPFVIEVQIEKDETEKAPAKILTYSEGLRSSEDTTMKSLSPQRHKPVGDTSTVILLAGVNKSGEVINLTLPKGQCAPRVLFRTIALSLPFQRYLTKLNLQSADFLTGALIYDLAKMLPDSFITDLNLDDSPVFEANQYLLLDSATRLEHLSLDRCCLSDAGIKKIAASLEPPRPAAYKLRDLSVSTNAITDKGAAALTKMLRSNRKLMRLNLSGNQLSDAAGEKLLSVFGLFELTPEEENEAKKRHLQYLLQYRTMVSKLYEKELLVLTAPPSLASRRKSVALPTLRSRKASESSASITALVEAKKKMGEFSDPFIKPNVTLIDGKLCSLGNLSLCCLNLAYNNLRRNSMVKLTDVLLHQRETVLKDASLGCGLLRVVIDGNDPFVSIEELGWISELLNKALESRGSVKKRRGHNESLLSRTSTKIFRTKSRS